jgi:hypothetical protein
MGKRTTIAYSQLPTLPQCLSVDNTFYIEHILYGSTISLQRRPQYLAAVGPRDAGRVGGGGCVGGCVGGGGGGSKGSERYGGFLDVEMVLTRIGKQEFNGGR